MSQIDTFGAYVRARLDGWGREFALHRDCEYLGHASRNMLQVLIDHRGEMPPRNVGYKPLEVDRDAHGVELMVTEIARQNRAMACVLRAYYCGSGRRHVERLETANLLCRAAMCKTLSLSAYKALHALGFERVRGQLEGMARAA